MKIDYWNNSFIWIGLIITILGILLILVPHLIKYIPEIQEIHPLLLYVYRRGNFWFATSPILIIISILSVMIYIISHRVN